MSNPTKIKESKIKQDLDKRALIYANSLIYAILIAFPLTGIADFILLEELAGLAFVLRLAVAVISFFFFKFTRSKNMSPNYALFLSYLLINAVLGFELYLSSGEVEIFIYLQIVAIILGYNAVALWPARMAMLLYVLGMGVTVGFYSLDVGATFQGFFSGGGSFVLMAIILPLALPAARYSANRLNARKTLQLQQVLVELKNRNIELSKAQESLQRYEKAGSNRLRIGIHDVNNRISSLDYLVELMNMKFKENQDIMKYLEKLKEVSQEIRVFTTNVLSPPDTDHGETGVRMESKKMAVAPVVMKVISDVEKKANAKEIIIQQVLPKEDVYIVADPTYLTTAVRNLLAYAVQYSREDNQIIIGVGARNNKVFIEVNDKTRGITQSTLEMMFNKLPNNYSESVTEITETEGIGLSVAKFFIEKMGGKLDYQTAINKGLRFIIVFDQEFITETSAENV